MWQLANPATRLEYARIGQTVLRFGSFFADNGDRAARLNTIKRAVYQRLQERLDLSRLEGLPDTVVAAEIRRALAPLLEEVGEPVSPEEKQSLAQDLEYEVLGLGPLEPLLKDPTISDILVNRFDQVYIERHGKLEKTDIRFWDNRHLLLP